MQKLNFPDFQFRFKNRENKTLIFDVIRKKFVVLTPEEWVRQHVVHLLIIEKGYSKALINVEKQIKLHNTNKRYDIIVYQSDGNVELIVECKAPSINISQDTFDQIARYNFALNSAYLMVTNGMSHYYCKMDWSQERYDFLQSLPAHDKK